MTTYACPNCQHSIHLPEGVSQTATLQCPMCGHNTPASALAHSAGPTWIVVEPGDPAHPMVLPASTPELTANKAEVPAADETSITPSGSTDEADYELADPNQPKADRTRKQPIKQQDWSKHKPLTHEEYQRRKRKSGSPVAGIVQVVLGGALALPIAQLLIWHALGKDPFELAPKVGAYAPWILPYKLRPYASSDDNRFVERSSPKRSNTKSSGIARDFDAELAASVAESEKKPNKPAETPPTEVKEDTKTAEREEAKDKEKEKELPAAPMESTDTVTKDAPLSESEKLTAAIAATRQAMDAWSSVAKDDGGERRKIANSFYSNLATTVEQFAKIENEPSARIIKRKVDELTRDIVKDAELIQLVRAGGFAKLSKGPESISAGSGLALIASFDDAAEADHRSIKVRKSVVADAEETEANTQRRDISLHRDVLLGEQISGEYLVLTVAQSEPEPEAAEKKRDVIWFAIPLE